MNRVLKIIKKIYKWMPFALLYLPFKVLSLVPFRRKVLLFGTGTGVYHDNSKYLFEYVIKHKELYSNYEVYWVAKNDKVYNQLREKSLPVVKYNSLKLILLSAQAKAYFITAEIFDIFWYVNKFTKVIQLWHGIPIKCINYDYKDDIKKIDFKKKYFTKDYLFERFDFFIIEDSIYKPIFESAFQIESKKFKPYGQPRNEFLHILDKNSLKNKINDGVLKKFDKVILYAPTFRKQLNSNVLLVKQILCSKNIEYLEQHNYCLVIKLHPFLRKLKIFDELQSTNVLNFSEYDDIQELLVVSDAVVTDISSLALDYLTFSTNLYTYFPDENKYLNDRDSFYEISYEKLKSNSARIDFLDEISFKNTNTVYNKKNTCKNIMRLIHD